MRLGHTEILSCIMHGLALREKRRNPRQPYTRENDGTRGCTRIIKWIKILYSSFQSSYRHGTKGWILCSTLRARVGVGGGVWVRTADMKEPLSSPVWTRSLALPSLRLEACISAHSIPTSLCALRSSSLVYPRYIPIPQPQEHRAFQFFATR